MRKTWLVLPLLVGCAGSNALDLSATPRPDENLELLALRVSGAVVAPQDVYDRVVRDVTAIRATHPELQGIVYSPPDDGKSLLLIAHGPAADTARALFQDLYARWRLAESRGLMQLSPDSQMVLLRFRGNYDMTAVAKEFSALPGVSSAGPDWIITLGRAPTICLTRDRSWYRYVFDLGGGGCDSCAGHQLGFSADASGAIAFEVDWDPLASVPVPEFIERYGPGVGTSCSPGPY